MTHQNTLLYQKNHQFAMAGNIKLVEYSDSDSDSQQGTPALKVSSPSKDKMTCTSGEFESNKIAHVQLSRSALRKKVVVFQPKLQEHSIKSSNFDEEDDNDLYQTGILQDYQSDPDPASTPHNTSQDNPYYIPPELEYDSPDEEILREEHSDNNYHVIVISDNNFVSPPGKQMIIEVQHQVNILGFFSKKYFNYLRQQL